MRNFFQTILVGLLVATQAHGATVRTTETGIVNWDDTTTPANPSAGYYKTYFKSDGKLYKLNSSGTESEIISAAAGTLTASFELSNVGFAASISSNTLIVALKQADGSTDCSSGTAACNVGFRNTTQATGGYNQISFTAAASITLAATDSIGMVNGVALPIWVYLIDDSTDEICLSRSHFSDGILASASALTAGADTTSTVLWCTSAHTSKPVRKIGKISATWSNPNWSAITEATVSVKPTQGCDQRQGSPEICTETVTVSGACSSNPCTITDEHGEWLSTVGWVSTGSYSLNFNAGVWSAAPACWYSGDWVAGYYNAYPTTTTSTFVFVDAGGTLRNSKIGATCRGLR